MRTILLIEDDLAQRTTLVRVLAGRYALRPADTTAEALSVLASTPIDLVVLDLDLPDLDSGAALRIIRTFSTVPVIVTTTSAGRLRASHLLDAGADDYLVKPFSADQLTARVNALLRPAERIMTVGALRIDLSDRTATFAGAALELTRLEFDLLAHLAKHAGTVVSRQALSRIVWHGSGSDQTIDVHVSWLRRKLGESGAKPRYLHTVRGVGIKLVDPG